MKRFILLALIFTVISSSIFANYDKADEPLPSGPKPKDRPSVALVLAGGGAKGFAHLPVIELIEQVGIPIDMVVGTSIGSIIGGLYAAGYTTSEILKGFDQIDWTPLFLDNAKSPYESTLDEHSLNRNLFSLNFGIDLSLKLGKGLSTGQNVYQLLKNMTLKYPSDQDFNELNIPFRSVVTDMLTGEALVINQGDLAEAIRASMSLPSIFEPAEMDGHYLLDGGVRYNLAINVAKNMGYDIIIAVDISQKVRDNPEVYSSNPGVAMLNTITIAQYTATEAMYKDAELVIFPDISKYGTMDFKKAKQIYDEGKAILEEYEPRLEEIRRKIYPKDYDSNGKRISKKTELKTRGVYRKRPNLIPTQLTVEGALNSDLRFINNAFQNIYDEELTPSNFENFMKSIYLTGNYSSIRPRIYEHGEDTVLSLELKQKERKQAKFLTDFDLTQTISPKMMTAFNINLEAQLRGLTGPGSVLALSGTALNDYGVSLYYLQPFTPNFFMQADVRYIDKRYSQMNLDLRNYDYTGFASYRKMNADLVFGARGNSGSTFTTGFYYNYSRSTNLASLFNLIEYAETIADEDYDEEYENIMKDYTIAFIDSYIISNGFGGYMEYNLDLMDRDCFAHQGFSLDTVLDMEFAYDQEISKIYDPVLNFSIDLKSAIPLGSKLSINNSIFTGLNLLSDGVPELPVLINSGYSAFDRVFFPQVTDESFLGQKKIAGEFSLQFEPWNQLTILGGTAFFRITGTAGRVFDRWNQLFSNTSFTRVLYPVLWSASGGFGIRVKDGWSIYLRAGAASNDESQTVPFMSLDIGSIQF